MRISQRGLAGEEVSVAVGAALLAARCEGHGLGFAYRAKACAARVGGWSVGSEESRWGEGRAAHSRLLIAAWWEGGMSSMECPDFVNSCDDVTHLGSDEFGPQLV